MSAILAYIGAPYSDPDPVVVAARMAAFDKAIADMLTAGEVFPVSPLLNHAIVGKHSIPGNWTFWQHYSRRLLARCDALHILTLPGWKDSTGVGGEMELAASLSIPIRMIDYDRGVYERAAAEAHMLAAKVEAL